MSKKLFCSIVTPERSVFEGKAELIVIPAYDGEMGFLYSHAPLITSLGNGEVRLYNGKEIEYIAVHSGFAEIRDNKLVILAESAFKKEDINIKELERKIEELRITEKPKQEDKRQAFVHELNKLKINLKMANRQ